MAIGDARDMAQVVQVQGKQPTYHAITLTTEFGIFISISKLRANLNRADNVVVYDKITKIYKEIFI